MDAVKCLKEWKRMCDNYDSCNKCPVGIEKNRRQMHCSDFRNNYEEEFVEIVSKWSIDNPSITNRKKFLEVFGITLGDAMIKPNWLDDEYKE